MDLNILSKCKFGIIFMLNSTATTEIYTYVHTLSLHDALPISGPFDGCHQDWTLDGEFVTGLIASEIIKDVIARGIPLMRGRRHKPTRQRTESGDRKSTRLNSSH